jgi:hypothetical protein
VVICRWCGRCGDAGLLASARCTRGVRRIRQRAALRIDDAAPKVIVSALWIEVASSWVKPILDQAIELSDRRRRPA